MVDFMNVEDMTDAELKQELRWINNLRADGVHDVVLMFRLEELDDEIQSREEQ